MESISNAFGTITFCCSTEKGTQLLTDIAARVHSSLDYPTKIEIPNNRKMTPALVTLYDPHSKGFKLTTVFKGTGNRQYSTNAELFVVWFRGHISAEERFILEQEQFSISFEYIDGDPDGQWTAKGKGTIYHPFGKNLLDTYGEITEL